MTKFVVVVVVDYFLQERDVFFIGKSHFSHLEMDVSNLPRKDLIIFFLKIV